MHLTKHHLIQGVNNMTKEVDMLDRVNQAITNIRRGKQKLTISRIAEKANIARETIYNRPELKQRCDQAIHIQEQQNIPSSETATSTKSRIGKPPLSGSKLLEKRYKRARNSLKLEQEKNAKLLGNNRKLVLEKDQFKGRILFLERKIEKMREGKVKSFNYKVV